MLFPCSEVVPPGLPEAPSLESSAADPSLFSRKGQGWAERGYAKV